MSLFNKFNWTSSFQCFFSGTVNYIGCFQCFLCFRYYAFVYVKTDTDVGNIIRGLNNLKLNGRTLVVNSVEKMLKEGLEAGELEIEKE